MAIWCTMPVAQNVKVFVVIYQSAGRLKDVIQDVIAREV